MALFVRESLSLALGSLSLSVKLYFFLSLENLIPKNVLESVYGAT